MLVLTRKAGESIVIGEDVEVKVLEVKGRQVKLGIVAPPHIRIMRRELYERIREQNIRAASGVERLDEILNRRSEDEGKD